ncbi:hypothetical protein BDV59DRAFT_185944 [Aspergillus ambiguus]|uniref:putative DNA mismatch repair protein (Mlh3) n=1 Tax=Aspergillus ambiguus TaxID=176160 RepID=UPI003CCCBE70
MSQRTPSIEPLPPDVVAKLKSSTSIINLNGVIVELVKNALDANAHTVYVTVDFQRGGCVVEDDGDGIPSEEFKLGGGLGKAHHTSKFHPDHDAYGRKGLFLASLSALSLLTIASHHVRESATNAIIFHHSTPVARLIPASVHHELRFRAHGTRVTVNDLFGNMPVRVKSRSLALQKPDELDRQWDELRNLLVSLIVANEGLTKLVLSDTGKDKRFAISPRPSRLWRAGELDNRRVASILNQAGLVDFQSLHRWDTVSACVPDLTIHAAICITPSPTKKVQFISLGINPVFPRNNANLLYSEINRLFASSDFGTTGVAPDPSADDTSDGIPQRPASKSVNRWPMFYIRIDTDGAAAVNDDDEEVPESDKSLQRIIDVLGAMVFEFLSQHHLRPRVGRRRRQVARNPRDTDTSPVPGAAPMQLKHGSSTEEALCDQVKIPTFEKPAQRSEHFDGWSRIKSAKETVNEQSAIRAQRSNGGHLLKEVDIYSTGNSHTETLAQLQPDETVTGTPEADRLVPWTDPCTGRTYLVNSRTGQSANVASRPRPYSTGSFRISKSLEQLHRPRSAMPSAARNTWAENALSLWENPVFSRAEQPINVFDTGQNTPTTDRRPHGSSGDLCRFEDFGLSKFRGKLHRQDLDAVEVLAQVDCKFVLAKLRPSPCSGSVLVLIDQHAADERCRVERLFGELFTADSISSHVRTLAVDPIVFEVAKSEVSLFERYRKFFGSWGVGYTVECRAENRISTIVVSTLPSLIAERCRVEPNLVTDLIRGEIWTREENGRGPSEAMSSEALGRDEAQNWVAQMTGCPKGIIELLNSRACRTAIMFNDPLTVAECQKLVEQLARCLFPFQCAHGRPSMIPILDMGNAWDDPDQEYEGDGGSMDFIEAFRKWEH